MAGRAARSWLNAGAPLLRPHALAGPAAACGRRPLSTLMPELTTVLVEQDGMVATVTVNRPRALNALNVDVIDDLGTAFAALKPLAETSQIRCVILTGAGGKSFVAGADIKGMTAMNPAEAQAYAATTQSVFEQVETFPAPVIAAVNGFALGGGCELASSCDMIYASANAKFGQPEVTLGLIPGFAGTVRLPRRIGLSAAMEWTYTGNLYTAVEAKDVGLVLKVLPPAELMPHAQKVAATIAKRAPIAVRESKRLMVDGVGRAPGPSALAEQEAFGGLFATADAKEGCAAFVEKRKPEWSGH